MNSKIKFLTGKVFALLATLTIAASANATPDVLDWDTLTWLPAGNTNLSETYTIGSGDITVTFSGNTAGLEQAGADIAPSINMLNTGGLTPAQNSLYVGTDYADNSNPMVIITIDFVGYPGGVGNFSFDVFDMDNGGAFIDEMTVTANTLSGTINPTSIVTGSANMQTTPNTVRGTAGAVSSSANANITWVFGDAGTPVSGITQINIIWRNQIGTANPGLQWINIHDFMFDDPMADTELTKSVAPTSAGAGESVVFTLDAVNNGPDAAPGVQITDQLPAGFTYLSDNGGGSYVPGTGVWTIGTLAASGTAQLMITARMEGTGPWDNSAEVTQQLATDPDSTPGNNVPAEDDQDNAAVTLLVPEIGTAKAVTTGPTNNGDGTYTLTYTTTVVNSGDTAINSLQVIDNLAATFAAATGFVVDSVSSPDFTVNAGFNGTGDTALLAGTDSIAVATSGTIAMTVTVTPGGSLGPYNNTATAGGLSPGAVPVSDDSTDGANPDPDGDGNPGNNSVPTPVTFGENPEIGTAKRVVATPTNNGDGTYTLTYEVTLVNSGDVALNNVQVVDDMAATFAGTTGVVVDSVVSGDFTVNGGYDGNGANNVLAGTDTLGVGVSGTVSITVTVTSGGALGPFDNTATGSGTSPGGMGVNDVSESGTNPDPDGDGNPGNNSTPTPISFTENPQIGLAKAITAGPVNNGDGTHTLTYTLTVENFGDGALSSVQVVDNLSSTYSGATGFVVDSVTSADFAANAGFNGAGDTNVLAGTDTLAIGATGTVDVTVTVTPGGTLGPYDNSAFARGFSPAGALTIDTSVDGLDPDPDGNGDPVDNVSPTPVTFGENPEIGTAKLISAGPTNNGDGTHTLTYRVTVVNSGDVTLNNVQVVDDLATTYAAATSFVVDSTSSADFTINAGYNGAGDTNVLSGTDSLATGASGTVDFTVTVTPGGTLGPYDNTATADGTSPGGMNVSDASNTGVNPDPDGDGNPGNNSVPTPVTFGENPEIGTAKRVVATPTNNGDGTYTLTYEVTLVNSGDVALNNVQVVDDMAATFAGTTGVVVDSVVSGDFTVNGGYDGNGANNVLAGTDTLGVGVSGTVSITVTVTSGGALGPFDNTATGSGTSPGGMGVNDVSESGTNPDPDGDGNPGNNSTPTPISFTENPQIGLAKAITAGPVNNGDGTHTLTYTLTVENFGDGALSSVQVVDNLSSTYSGATGFVVDSVTSADFAANAGFNGAGDTNVLAGTDTLAIGATGTVDVTVTVTPGGTLGPYDNSAFARGFSPAGALTIDTSVDGLDPDPDGNGDPVDNVSPTPVTFGENPEIGTAKLISAGPTNNGDGTHTLTYRVTVVNSGDVTLNNVQVVDDLATTYAAATSFVVDSTSSADFTINAGYNGAGDTNVLSGTDSLATGASGTVDITVTVTPGGFLGAYDNNATANGTSPAGMGVSDVSNTGVNPDPDGDGNPGNNSMPTQVTFGENPEIGTAKIISAGPTDNGDGTVTLTYRVTVVNSGDVGLNSVQVFDDLATTFATATGFVVDSVTSADFTVNTGFNGAGDANVLAGTDSLAIGASGTVDITLTLTPGGALGPYNNNATADGTSSSGTNVSDLSTDGLNPDPDGDGNPGNNGDPTPLNLPEIPEIGIAKTISSGPTNNGDGTFTFTYTMTVENSGNVALNNAQVVTDLSSAFAAATGFVVDSVTSADFTVNVGYDGSGDTNLLAGTDTMAVGATGTIDLTITVTPGGVLGPYDCIAVASGTSPAGTGVNDISTVGVDPDPDGDGDPGNNSDPTPVTFGENPEIGIAKTISTGPTNNGDGTFTFTYTMTVENSGDVVLSSAQVVTDLGSAFAAATGFVVDSVTSADFTVNAGYDGSGDTNLLAGTDTMAVGATGTIDLTITVTPGGVLGPYDCIAIALGTSPAGTGVSDTSTDGVDPDPDGDGNPSNNSDPTPVTFGENPEIGIAKTISAGPINNGDGTFTFTYTMTVENSGDVALNNGQVVTDLSSAFAAATGFVVDSVTSADFAVNAGYDGSGDTSLLAGTDTMAVGATGTIDLTITVTPGGVLGPYDCIAVASGTSPAGTGVNDTSTDGIDPDPDADGNPGNNSVPTPVTFVENPEIGIAKTISAGPTNNGDGTFTFTYTMTVENSGDVALSNGQVVTDLSSAFAAATGFVVDSVTSADFAVNGGYDGSGDTNLLAGTDTIAAGATGTIDLTITVTPGGVLGPYDCIAVASGTSPAGTGVSDISNAGVNPDPDGDGDPGNNSDPTPVTFGENPEIGIAKTISTGPTNNGDGTFTFTYTMTVANSGDVVLSSAQVVTDLGSAFAAATGFVVDSVTSADFTVNAGYDGSGDTNLLAGTDTMAVGATGTIDLTITVTPGGVLGPYDCIAIALGTSPAGTGVSDTSTDGVDPDPDGDGNPSNNSDPTPVTFGENPEIGIAKTISAGPINNGDGTFTFTYTMTVENSGDVALNNGQVVTDLSSAFAAATGFVVDSVTSADFAVNAGYDGSGDTSLLAGTDTMAVGATGTIDLTITVTPGGVLGPYDCIAVASGTSPAGTGVNDTSTVGVDPDPDGDGDPGNNSDPTPVNFGESPQIGVAKTISAGPTNNGDGTFTFTYTMTVVNSGDVALNNAQVVTDLSSAFSAAAGFVVDSVTSTDFAVNAGYDGSGDTNLLAGSDTMAIGATGTIDLTITVTPGGVLGPYDCIAIAVGTSPAGTGVSDTSTDGVDPDPDADGNPSNNSVPTSVSFQAEATLEGNAWLDLNIDDQFDSGEPPLDGWLIEVVQGGVVVATVPINPDGSYSVAGLPPGSGYSVRLRHPSSTAVFGTIDGIVLPPGLTVIDQNLPIDPSGVIYDSVTRLPIPGVTVTMVDSGGTPLPAACLLPGQQNQVVGADGLYRFDVLLGGSPACTSGDVFDLVFTTPAGYVPGLSTSIPPTPGPLSATGLPDPFQVQPQAGPPTGGASTLYYLSFMLSSGDPNIINNHIPIDPIAPAANLLVSKQADRRQTVVGEQIIYTITIQNPGAALAGLTLSDMIPPGFTYVTGSARLQPATGVTATGQRPVVFSGINVAAGGSTTLRYMLRVGPGVVQGNYINTVTPLIGGVPVGNTATATVTVTADPDFEQTTIVGSVFNDANGDGWQDEGELGIPGVRLATVEGLIIETDAFGRYHIAGVDGGRRDRGRNFIIKVDPNTLPDGVNFTTENPRVQRITEGLLNRFDFGVNMPDSGCCEQIDVKIGEVFFQDGSSKIRPEFMPLITQLADRLRDTRGGTLYLEGHAEPAEAVAYTAAAYRVTQHFAPRSAKLSDQDKRELDRIIERWRGVENISVAAVGHTCNTGIAPKNRKEFKDNYELSRARAQTVASYVRLGLGISPEQVTVAGKGPDEPVASNATPEGGAANRRVELSISGQKPEQSSTDADLARDRANAIYNELRKLLGEDLIRNINITGDAALPESEIQESEMTSHTSSDWLSRSASALLGLLVSSAHADGLPAACTIDSCMTDKGYAIQILPSSDIPSPNDTRAALADNKRVDVSGRFSVPLAGGGQLWATEDPSAAVPRLAAHGPEVTPVADGKLAMPVSFFVYSNYPAFIEKAEIQIFHGNDIDMIEPLVVLPFKPGVYSRIDWEGAGLSRALAADDELYYRVRAYDEKGRYDETHLDHLRLVSMEEYKRSAESDPSLLLPKDFGSVRSKTSSLRGPLDGNVLVLKPPAEKVQRTRGSYTVTPHFDSRKTALKDQDRSELDRIITEWKDAEELVVHVIGHTDNIRIAPHNRHEFANNTVLSKARARVVGQYVATRLGIKPSQVISEGRADKEPVASNATAAGRAKNRRVDVTITGIRQTVATTQMVGKTLVEPHSNTSINITQTLDEALNLLGARLGDSEGSSVTGRRYADPAPAQSSAHALEAIYGQSNLRVQRIPVNGSRVRINGQDIGANLGMRINGDPVPLDAAGKYAVEYVVPVGSHDFDIELIDERGNVTQRKRIPVEVSGKQIFMVALADFTLSDNSVSGSIEPTSGDHKYDDDMLLEGRLAFYLKGKIKGKYLLTAQMDSQEEELGDLFSNLFDKDPKSVLRRLDPDRYYPVYGDDSTTINDIDTQGRLYVRADWDRSHAVWGNFHTGLTGNEFAQYNRSLYGAQYRHESLNITDKGEAKTQAIAFVSEAQTAFGHSEFSGTGGSLYYLRHQDILPGSEKAWIEIRDRDSNRVRELITLTRGMDYEVDEIQGRMILSRPLMTVSGLHAPGLIKDTPLDGNDLVLLVDYEYIPIGFNADKVTVGGSGKIWLTDDVAVGATVVEENRSGESYGLLGGDILWQPGVGTYVKGEFAQSEATQADRFQSTDGGLTFSGLTPTVPGRDGDAWSVEARVNSREAMNTEGEWVGGIWYRNTDKDFSVSRRDLGIETTEYGVELTGTASERMSVSARASVVERGVIAESRRLSLQADYKLTDRSTVSGEVRSVDERIFTANANGLLLALRYSHSLREGVEVYGIGQATLDNDSGRYDNNDLGTIGVRVNINDRTAIEGEYSSGHRGSGALLGLDYRLDDRHEVYGTFTQSVDRTDLLEPGTKVAIGHRSRITDQATLFNERQFTEDRGQAGIAHVFGLDFELNEGWAFGLSMQQNDQESDFGEIERDAATVTATYRSEIFNWRGKVEFREESAGLTNVDQLLTTNRMDLKLSEDWRMLTRFNHAESDDNGIIERDSRFTEAGVGFAYRPVANSRLSLLAKFTYLYDLPAPQQLSGSSIGLGFGSSTASTDQKSRIVSVEGNYRLNPHWEIGGKLAQRSGELRTDRDFGEWFESTTNFAALRARYHLIRRWDALVELRRLDVDEADSNRTGWLLGLDRHINDNFRLGIGYNFTDFSDNLTNLDYDHKGWFLNALGKY